MVKQNYLNLHDSKRNKNDEFYTQLKDIEEYLCKFIPDFNNKYIYCNCDGLSSNFYIYFKTHFKEFNLRHLTATEYNKRGAGTRIDFDGTIETVTQMDFFNSGSFDCDTSIHILKQCDIVITNPPFSLFRQYYDTLKKYNKKFIVLGFWMAFACSNVLPDIINKKTFFSNNIVYFFTGSNKQIMCCWYNNIRSVDERKDTVYTCKYNKDLHKECDNWKCLFIKKQKDIPIDYYDLIVVPLGFIYTKEFWNNYEFVCMSNTPSSIPKWVWENYWKEDFKPPKGIRIKDSDSVVNGKVQFIRIVVRRKKKTFNTKGV